MNFSIRMRLAWQILDGHEPATLVKSLHEAYGWGRADARDVVYDAKQLVALIEAVVVKEKKSHE